MKHLKCSLQENAVFFSDSELFKLSHVKLQLSRCVAEVSLVSFLLRWRAGWRHLVATSWCCTWAVGIDPPPPCQGIRIAGAIWGFRAAKWRAQCPKIGTEATRVRFSYPHSLRVVSSTSEPRVRWNEGKTLIKASALVLETSTNNPIFHWLPWFWRKWKFWPFSIFRISASNFS